MTAHARHHTDTAADHLRDMITDLTRTRSHREHLTRPTAAGGDHSHFTRMPPLLMQLQWGDWTKGTDRSGAGYESRPAASIEALDTLVQIDLAAARWIRDLGEDDPASTIACVTRLGGLLPSTTRCQGQRGERDAAGRVRCCTWHAIEHDVRQWWTQARLVTGWDAPAWRPNNTCPNCGELRALRIRLAERIGFCTSCRETWGPEAYQVLADHVRAESEQARRTPAGLGPCRCVWPREGVAGLGAMCPRCGAASCVNAVRALPRKAG